MRMLRASTVLISGFMLTLASGAQAQVTINPYPNKPSVSDERTNPAPVAPVEDVVTEKQHPDEEKPEHKNTESRNIIDLTSAVPPAPVSAPAPEPTLTPTADLTADDVQAMPVQDTPDSGQRVSAQSSAQAERASALTEATLPSGTKIVWGGGDMNEETINKIRQAAISQTSGQVGQEQAGERASSLSSGVGASGETAHAPIPLTPVHNVSSQPSLLSSDITTAAPSAPSVVQAEESPVQTAIPLPTPGSAPAVRSADASSAPARMAPLPVVDLTPPPPPPVSQGMSSSDGGNEQFARYGEAKRLPPPVAETPVDAVSRPDIQRLGNEDGPYVARLSDQNPAFGKGFRDLAFSRTISTPDYVVSADRNPAPSGSSPLVLERDPPPAPVSSSATMHITPSPSVAASTPVPDSRQYASAATGAPVSPALVQAKRNLSEDMANRGLAVISLDGHARQQPARRSQSSPQQVREMVPVKLEDSSSTAAARGPGKWQAVKGADLHETLAVWSMEEGVELIWASDFDFSVPVTMSVEGPYQEAVLSLLDQYQGGKRPLGSLHVDPATSGRALVIQSKP